MGRSSEAHKNAGKRLHSSWVGYPSGGHPTKQEWSHLTVAYLIREKPVRNRASSVPTTTVPDVRVEVEGRGYRHRWREKRGHRAKARNEQPCQRVSGEKKRRSPIIESRTSGKDWQPAHGSAAKPGSRGNAAFGCAAAHAQHVRDRGVGISPTRKVWRVDDERHQVLLRATG
jgi:hypothetical protein